MDKKTDLRVIKTKRNLYEGLARLLNKKPYENIKIKDICDESLVNRSTFYDHYSSKNDLLKDMINERKKNLAKEANLKNITHDNYKETFISYVEKTIDFISLNININKNIFLNGNNHLVKNIIFDALIEDISEALDKINISNVKTEALARFYVAGFAELICLYLEDPKTYNKEIMVAFTTKIINKK